MFTSPEGRGRIASQDAIRVRAYGPSIAPRPLTRIALKRAIRPLPAGER